MESNLEGSRLSAEQIASEIAATQAQDHIEAAKTRCGDNQNLLRDVLGFLGAYPQSDPLINQKVGSFKIHSRLGGGGNGDVYRATRIKEPHQQVAIKFLRLSGGDNEEFRRRFLRERQITALLNHPYIVKLFDADRTKDGTPYFAMECVEGQHLDQYAKAKRLTVSQRIDLFLKICDAVQYLHTRFIVHRDLKPANILVNAGGDPKVLDFGIAKLLQPELLDGVIITMLPLNPLTVQYASPEQWTGGVITSASDVYSLGVVLFQLLTGVLPIPVSADNLAGYRDAVCKGSQTLASKSIATEHSHDCRVSSQNLESQLRGDLDAILAKALQADVNERYPTVAALVDDIRRHLEFMPVHARRGLVSYRVRRFLRRNRAWVLSIAAVMLALTAGFVSTRIQRDQAVKAQLEAQHQQKIATKEATRLSTIAQNLEIEVQQIRDKAERQQITINELRLSMTSVANRLEATIKIAQQQDRGEGGLGPLRDSLLGKNYATLGRLRALSGDFPAAARAYQNCLTFLNRAQDEGDGSLPTATAKNSCSVDLAQIAHRP